MSKSNNLGSTSLSAKNQKLLKSLVGVHQTQMGYEFDFLSDKWRLDGSSVVNWPLLQKVDLEFELGLRAALSRYAETYSAVSTLSLFKITYSYIRKTGRKSLSLKGISEFKSKVEDWDLGSVKSFWLTWYDWGFPGIEKEAVKFLDELVLSGMEKGKAVKGRCPFTGPYSELEQSAIYDWSANTFQSGELSLRDYVWLMSLMYTGRRSVQLRHLRACDLSIKETSKGNNYTLNVPRAKQKHTNFRREFNAIPISEDLYLLMKNLIDQSILGIEEYFAERVSESLKGEIPVFIEWNRVKRQNSIEAFFVTQQKTPDFFHSTTSSMVGILWNLSKGCTAMSERTGEVIHLFARRFRYTKATNLARKGISGVALAQALDHSDTQHISIYTLNTSKNAEIINEVMADALAPLAQAFAGTLINSEREALRANDPHSRVKNDQSSSIGNCGTNSFCANGYRSCYTCVKFQPWIDAPHHEVLEQVVADRERQKERGVSPNVIKSTDRLLLAVTEVIQLCKKAKADATQEAV